MINYDKYFLKNRPAASINTLKAYNTSIRTLSRYLNKKIETPKDLIDNVDEIIKVYENVKYTTRKSHIAAFISFIDNGTKESKEALDKLRKVLITDVNQYNEYLNTQTKSDIERENWLEWSEIIKRYQSFEKEIGLLWKLEPEELSKANYNKLKLYVLLSCYVLIPPRRNLDYTAFKIRNYDPTKDNYMKGKKFIFNNYKTARTYGTNEVKIPNKLYSIMNKWIKLNPSDYLLTGATDKYKPITGPQLTTMLNTFFDKRVSVNLLRHSFLTHMYKDLPDLKEMKERAEEMGHSLDQALEYVKKDKDE